MSMMLSRRNRPLDFFDDFFSTDILPFDRSLTMPLLMGDDRVRTSELTRWMPQVDISETDDKVKILANVPGMKKEDIKLEVDEENRSLRMWGEYSQEKKDEGETFHRVERHYGKFDRTMRLPRNVDLNNINANVKEGVLCIEVPKMQQQRKTGRAIPIQ